MDQELIQGLNKLRKFLNELHKELSSSGVERTSHFLTFVGEDCTYFKKSMELFLSQDYDKLKDCIRDLCDLFDIIEGKRPNGRRKA